jgi:hypothetical protein
MPETATASEDSDATTGDLQKGCLAVTTAQFPQSELHARQQWA